MGESNKMTKSSDLSFEFLKAHISPLSDIPPVEWDAIRQIFSLKRYSLGDFFIRKGEHSASFGFIVRGAMKVSYDINKKERIKNLLFEEDFAGSYTSLLQGGECKHSIEVFEDSSVLLADYTEFKKFYLRHKCWEEVGRRIAEKEALDEEQRVFELLNYDAKMRLESFAERYRGRIARIPKSYIASYLGINPSTLSRISKGILK